MINTAYFRKQCSVMRPLHATVGETVGYFDNTFLTPVRTKNVEVSYSCSQLTKTQTATDYSA